MFQYALARRISLERHMPFKMDISFYGKKPSLNESPRTYDLDKFNIVENLASNEELERFINRPILKRIFGKAEQVFVPYHLRSVVREKHLSYDPKILKIRRGSYLQGYWQNEEYFKPIERTLREDLTFKIPPDKKNSLMLQAIQEKQCPVAIHIRRGDYLTDKNIASILFPYMQAYYQNAISFIRGKVDNPFFFVFTDEPAWAKDDFKIDYPNSLVSGANSDAPSEELRLMSSCKHFIIANSSFSWWAAWLGRSPDKIVIAPQQWYKSGLNIASFNWIKL